ncbi:hypothetical protein AQ515_19065 [Salmonella enterica]|nr:hypothetical protein [Salmonella enterica]
MQQLTFFSDWSNIIRVIIIIFFIMLSLYVMFEKTFYTIKQKIGMIFMIGLVSIMFGGTVYIDNYIDTDPLYQDRNTLLEIAININTFKKHEHKTPTEKDFYLSGFLNNSSYFKTKDGEKIFKPIQHKDFKLTDNEKSISFSYMNNYDNTSFIETGHAYRYCLSFPEAFKDVNDFKDIAISINGKEIDYKKATEESMRDICHSDKPNSYTLTFF